MSLPLDPRIKELSQLPHTISYVIRKRQQIDNLNELPKEKRPTEDLIWDGTSEELDEWLDRVLSHKEQQTVMLDIKESDVEG